MVILKMYVILTRKEMVQLDNLASCSVLYLKAAGMTCTFNNEQKNDILLTQEIREGRKG